VGVDRRRLVVKLKKAILLISILVASLVLAFVPSNVSAAPPAVTQVQTARGTSTTSSLGATLDSTPTSGNVLVAVIGYRWSGLSETSITGISQGDITWYSLVTSINLKSKVSIYLAVVPDSGSKPTSLTVSFSGSTPTAVVDVCEYSGLNTDFILANGYDTAAVAANTGTAISTGTTPTTAWPYELWVGGTMLNANGAQTTPTNGFDLIDGAVFSNTISVAYLSKTASSIGTAQSGTTGSVSGTWAGAIIALPLAPTITLVPTSGQVGASIQMTGDGFTPDSDITATFDGNPLTLVGTAHTDSAGHFVVTFNVPTASPGPYVVTATDEAPYSASETFTVIIPPVPENPVGVFASVAAIGLAFVAWTAIKRGKNAAKPAISI
jgi:hypothetical protein